MIKIFGVSETTSDLENLNGDCVLIPSKAILHKYENGEYYLELEASYDYADYFEQNRIVVVDLPYGGQEFFRMNNPIKMRGKCKCKCPQIYNDMKLNVRPFSATRTERVDTFYELLSWMNGEYGGFINNNGTFTIDDYTVTGQSDFPEFRFDTNGISFDDVVQSLIKNYGGYLYRNKRSFGISKNRITANRDVTIRYGKNLKALTKEEDWSEVCTYLLAKGSAGVEAEYTSETQYTYKYNRIVSFQQSVDSSLYDTPSAYQAAIQNDLQYQARRYIEAHTLPKINYTLDVLVDELPDGSGLEIQDIGDQIEVIDEELGINVTTYVLGFDFDLLLNKYNRIEFGNYTNSMRGYNDKIKDEIGVLRENVTNISCPVGTVIQSGSSSNPREKGFVGYWVNIGETSGIYSWRRMA